MRISTGSALALIALACLAAPRAHAQIGVYGQFSASNFNLDNLGWQYGTTFGIYDTPFHVPFFALGLDGRGTVLGSGSTKIVSGLVGPRLTFKPHVLPIMPYVEAVVGAGNVQFSTSFTSTNATKLEYQFLGGLDYTFFPHLDWRVVEFSYGGFSGPNLNPQTVSTGLVLRLP
jgi:hypothetical protein